MSRAIRFAPLVVLILVIVALIWRLATPVDTTVSSNLEGKPLPAFALPAVVAKPGLASQDLETGTPRILNIFASWCVPCVAEVKVLQELKRRGVHVDGIAIRDRPEDVAEFLGSYGDPFQRMGSDDNSRVQLALGSSGVPESFVVDGRGVIRYQHIGAIEPAHVPTILAELEKAK